MSRRPRRQTDQGKPSTDFRWFGYRRRRHARHHVDRRSRRRRCRPCIERSAIPQFSRAAIERLGLDDTNGSAQPGRPLHHRRQRHPKISSAIFRTHRLQRRSMFSETPPKRTVVFLGEGLDQSAVKGKRIGEIVTLPCKADRIGEIVDAMRAMNKGAAVAGDTIGGLPRAAVEDLLARCHAATYGVMVWAPPSLDFPNADLTVQAMSEFVKEINVTSRFAGLALGGNEGAVSAGRGLRLADRLSAARVLRQRQTRLRFLSLRHRRMLARRRAICCSGSRPSRPTLRRPRPIFRRSCSARRA